MLKKEKTVLRRIDIKSEALKPAVENEKTFY